MAKRNKEHHRHAPHHEHAGNMHGAMNEVADMTVGIVKVGAVTQMGMGMLGAMKQP